MAEAAADVGELRDGEGYYGTELAIALVCASNMNRSMEAHSVLKRHRFRKLGSYGTGRTVKLPGESLQTPNIYEFGTPYRTIYDDLRCKNAAYYGKIGMIAMLERNMQVKEAPQPWQAQSLRTFDLVFCYESRIFDAVVADTLTQPPARFAKPVYVINFHTRDTPEEAAVAGAQTLRLCQLLSECADAWQDRFDDILDSFLREHNRSLVYNVMFY